MPRKKNLNDGKRRDDKGRVLRSGEGQRKGGTYEYRFTEKQQKQFLEFIAEDKYYWRYLDFEKRCIRMDHQLVWTPHCKRYVEKTKTECDCRFIPMSDDVYRSLYNILANRKKLRKEQMIDGYIGFILLDKNGNPKVALHIEHVVTRIWQKYNDTHVIPLPKITPHVFRHTFCTNMANAGMDLKSLQYLMGHSDVSGTLNVYTHNSYEKAEEAMSRLLNFTEVELPRRKMRLG